MYNAISNFFFHEEINIFLIKVSNFREGKLCMSGLGSDLGIFGGAMEWNDSISILHYLFYGILMCTFITIKPFD